MMKKIAWIALFALMATLLSTGAVAEIPQDALLTEITLMSHFDWTADPEAAEAYLSGAGYALTSMAGGDLLAGNVLGAKTVAGEPVELFALYLDGGYMALTLTFPEDMAQESLVRAAEAVFGPLSDDEDWNTGGGVLLMSSENEDSGPDLMWLNLGQDLADTTDFMQAEYPEAGLAAVRVARGEAAPDTQPLIEENTGFTFKNGILFGMTQAEVLALEAAAPDIQDDEILIYEGVAVQGLEADLAYSFIGGALDNILYVVLEDYDEAAYLGYCRKLSAALSAKYGQPDLVEGGESDTEQYHLWRTDGVTIGLHLSEYDGEPSLTLFYQGPEGTGGSAVDNDI